MQHMETVPGGSNFSNGSRIRGNSEKDISRLKTLRRSSRVRSEGGEDEFTRMCLRKT